MRVDRGRDRDRIDGRIAEQFMQIGSDVHCRIALLDDGKFGRIEVSHRGDVYARYFCKISNQVRAPIAIPNNTNVDH